MTPDYRTCDTVALDTLLRCETTAVETYTRALGQFDDEYVISDLQKIRDEHNRAVRELRDRLIQVGGEPSDHADHPSADPVAGSAKAIGAAAVLAALRQLEEHNVSAYEAAVGSDDIHPDCQRVIRTDLLAAGRRHVDELNRILGGTNH